MRKLLTLIALIVFLSACGTTGGQTGSATPPALPTSPASPPTVAPETPAATPDTAPTQPAVPYPGPGQGYPAPETPAVINAPAELVQAVRERLATFLQKPADQLTVQQAASQEWPDESLGCPEAGKTYAQITIPGYLLTVGDGSRSYAVHTSLTALPGEPMYLCDNQVPTDLSALAAPTPAPSGDAQKMAELSRQDLAQKLGVDPATITILTTSPVEWNDSSLGCPKPDVNYLQVITSGYLVRLEAQGTGYEYHTDTGTTVVQCLP
jgi:hypothetical protein